MMIDDDDDDDDDDADDDDDYRGDDDGDGGGGGHGDNDDDDDDIVKDGGFAMGWKGMGVNDFRFLSGWKWVARLRFYTSFTPGFYRLITATYCSDVAK